MNKGVILQIIVFREYECLVQQTYKAEQVVKALFTWSGKLILKAEVSRRGCGLGDVKTT